MTKPITSPLVLGLVSIIPGLGIGLMGHRKVGFLTFVITISLFMNFWLYRSIELWMISMIIWWAQIIIPIASLIYKKNPLAPEENSLLFKTDFSPVPINLPRKNLVENVKKKLQEKMPASELLETVILGVDPQTQNYWYVGLTKKNFILAQADDEYLPISPQAIPNSQVQWIELRVGMVNSRFNVELVTGEIIGIQIPRTFQKQTEKICKAFPGNLSNEDYSMLGLYLGNSTVRETIDFYLKLGIYSVVCLFIFFVGAALRKFASPNPKIDLSFGLLTALGYSVFGWPFLFQALEEKKKAVTFVNKGNFYISGVMAIGIWIIAIYVSGYSILKYLH